jgi:hypothetical protein
MTQPWPTIRFPIANGRASAERWALKAQRRDFLEMVLPLEVLPLFHILTVLLSGAVGFYLLHRFAQ